MGQEPPNIPLSSPPLPLVWRVCGMAHPIPSRTASNVPPLPQGLAREAEARRRAAERVRQALEPAVPSPAGGHP